MASDGPLAGVRVLDLGMSWAGPFAGMILADLGADVIKVESSTKVDILRLSRAFADGVRDVERSGYYTACNRGKRSLTLNLKHDAAKELMLDLVASSDVLIENYAPRVMSSLGLAYEILSARNPGLVMISMSGYGATGPQGHFVSYGDHLLQASGMAGHMGFPGDEPTMIGTFYGDPVAGLYGAAALLAALAERDRVGGGRWFDLSQLEGLISLMPTELLRADGGSPAPKSTDRSEVAVPHGFFRARGADSWVSIAVRSDDEWSALRELLRTDGLEIGEFSSFNDRRDGEADIRAAIEVWAAARSPWDIAKLLQARGIPAYPLLDAPGLLRDVHLHERDFFQWVDRPVSGPGPIPGVTLRVSGGGARVRGYAPLLGEHNEEIIVGLLGRSRQEYERLLVEGALK